jgi:hypothetical protein
MNEYRVSRGIAPLILTSALDVDEWLASPPCRFTPGKEPLYPLIRKLGGSQSRSGRFWEEKISCPCHCNSLSRSSTSPFKLLALQITVARKAIIGKVNNGYELLGTNANVL